MTGRRYKNFVFIRLILFVAAIIVYMRNDFGIKEIFLEPGYPGFPEVIAWFVDKIPPYIVAHLKAIILGILLISLLMTSNKQRQISRPIREFAYMCRKINMEIRDFASLEKKEEYRNLTPLRHIEPTFKWRFVDNLFRSTSFAIGIPAMLCMLFALALTASVCLVKFLAALNIIFWTDDRKHELYVLSFFTFYALYLEGIVLYYRIKEFSVTDRIIKKEQWLY